MSAEQRELFEETLAADQASLEAQLEALQGQSGAPGERAALEPVAPRKPRRQALPEHLQRVEHRHEPESTTCGCGQPMVRVGEDISEKLDIVPAQFFVHRHIRGKWACKCCQALVQEPVEPHIIDKGMPAEGLLAHTLVVRFVDHLPYYRQEQINARSGVHTPRSTLAAWSGRAGAALMPLYEAHRAFVLGAATLHADETPVNMLDPGSGKTKRAYVWAYARSSFDALSGVAYDFCIGRAAKYPVEFLKGWSGTLVCDGYKVYESVLKLETRIEAGCMAHYPECSFIRSSTHEVTVRTRSRSGASRHINPANFNGSLHPIWPGSRMSLVWLLRHPEHSNLSPRPVFGTSCACGAATAVLARAARGNTYSGSAGFDATAMPSVLMKPQS
jgi:transposase